MQQETPLTVPEHLRISDFITQAGAVVPPGAKMEDVLDTFVKLKHLRQLVSAISKQYEQEAIGWCMENNTALVLNQDHYYYAGIDRTVKCKDVSKALENVLELTGGDFDEMVKLLVANPIKHGAYRDFIKRKFIEKWGPENEEAANMFTDTEWRKFFEKKEKDRMKEGTGKVKKLIEVDNERYRKSS